MTLCPNCNNPLVIKYPAINGFDILYCNLCLIGFTNPIPKDLSKYYHSHYWITPGLLGDIKTAIFKFFQKRRKKWVTSRVKKGEILDVGAGEARFGKSLEGILRVTSIDAPSSKIKNNSVLKVDFLSWQTKKRFDAVVFWESLEHMPSPQKYLQKAARLLKKGGELYIEYPRIDSIESKLFKNNWFHLDPPRHLNHLSKKGLEVMLKRVGLIKELHITTSAPDYAVWGFVASILSIFNINRTDIVKKSRSMFFLILVAPLFIIAIASHAIFRVTGQSSIGLMIARKPGK